MNVNCNYIVYFSVKSFYLHFRSFETYSCIISYCAAFYLSTFSHDAVCLSQSLVAHRIVKRENLLHSLHFIGHKRLFQIATNY